MEKPIHIKSTSKQTAICDEIVLRTGKKSRLVFKPMLVDNPNNPVASVKGTFVFQVKGLNESWDDYKTLDLSRLKKGEWIKLELKSEELLNLTLQLKDFYEIYSEIGIVKGETDVIITDSNISNILVELLNSKENLKKLLEKGGVELVQKTIQWIGDTKETEEIIQKLSELDVSNLSKVNSILGLSQLKWIFETWTKNRKNGDEEFWQQLIKNNSWTISQVFSFPIVILDQKAYLGGKEITNQGGNIIDFIFKNELTNNTILVEIKTPMSPIFGGKYRGNAYSLDKEITGAINQLLNYKDELQKSFYTLARGENSDYKVFNPRCLLIVGSIENEKPNNNQLKSFDLFRNDQRNIDIITFDEFFKKVDYLIKILENEL
jgi:hypothetical protein